MGRWRRAVAVAGMRGSLDRRLTALERAPGAGGVELRVYSTVAEADAEAEPTRPGTEVLRIITGVPRAAGRGVSANLPSGKRPGHTDLPVHEDAVASLRAEAITDGETEEEKQHDAQDGLNGSNDP